MKCRAKQLCLDSDLNTFSIFTSFHYEAADARQNTTFHSYNYLLKYNFIPEIEPGNTIIFADFKDRDLITKNISSSKLEILKNKRRQADFLKNMNLSHIFFSEFKLAIDDYGNINYLNRDF